MMPASNVSEISALASPPVNTHISRRSSPCAEENAAAVSERDPADVASDGRAGFLHAFDPNGHGASERLQKSPFTGSISPDL